MQCPLPRDHDPAAPAAEPLAACHPWTIGKPGQEPVPTAIDEWTESTSAA